MSPVFFKLNIYIFISLDFVVKQEYKILICLMLY